MTTIVTASTHFPLPLRGEVTDFGRRFKLTEPFRYIDAEKGEDITVPPGFDCDFNSVPRLLWSWFPPWHFPEAGVIHDYLYAHPGGRSRRRCDDLHRRVLHLTGMRRTQRLAVWSGLRAGGWVAWRQHRRRDA